MKRLLFTPVMLFLFISAYGQQEISRHEADSLLRSLNKSSADTNRISTLLKLAEFNILKPGEYKKDLDSAALFIDQAKRINNEVKSPGAIAYTALVESYLACDRKERPEAKTLAVKAVQLLSKSGNYYQLGRSYYYLAGFYDVNNDTEQPIAVKLIEHGVAAFKKVGAIEREAYGYRMLGEQDPGVKTSLALLDKSLSLYNSIHYQQLQGVYDLMATAYIIDLNLQTALHYELLALKTAESVHDTTMQLCAINNHLGIIFFKKRDYKNAAVYFLNALKIAETYQDLQTVYQLSDNLVNSYIYDHQILAAKKTLLLITQKYPVPTTDVAINYSRSSSFVKIYSRLRQIDQARPYVDQLINIINHNNLTKSQLIDDYQVIAIFYILSKQYGSAAEYLNKNDKIINSGGTPYDRASNNGTWFNLDMARHDYKAAVNHLMKSDKIKDSLFNATQAKQFQDALVNYQTKQKEDQIKILNQNQKLEKADLKQADLVRNVTIAGTIFVLIIAVLLYRQNRLKNKNNQVITHKNELLQHLLTEKEWLLKEVHHRVKNNLHTVICLLESQAAYLENDALKAIENSQHRIYAMSLIHQKLYQSDDIKTIDMAKYIPELVKYLEDSFDISDQIQFRLSIDPVSLNISHAIPLGLIINEAVSNSIKYAFPGKRKGAISISMVDDGAQITLVVADNGIGMPLNTNETESNSLGLELMKGLSMDIEGDISFDVKNGTRITIIFRPDTLNEPESFLNSSHAKGVYA